MLRFVFFLFVGLSLSLSASAQMQFVEVAKDIGIEHYLSQWVVGAGVSFCDFDEDGDDDITLSSTFGQKLGFYENQGGSFVEIAPLVPFNGEAKQIIWVDFDNDGDKDLFIAAHGSQTKLYRKTGPKQFEDISDGSGINLGTNFGYGAAWVDFDRDGWLDLFVNERISLNEPFLNKNYLFQNLGNGSFRDISENAGILDPGKIPFVGSFLDADNDMWPDLYTANDKLTRNALFMNGRNGRFYTYGEESGSDLVMNAMCVALGDYNNDGRQDIYVSNTPIGNALLKNLSGSNSASDIWFEEKAGPVGVGFYGNGWGSNFLDADNDGDLDLYASGSNTGSTNVSSIFYENLGNEQFQIPDAGFVGDTTSSFSNAIGDFNQDGYPDILVQNNPPFDFHIWENQGDTTNHWLKLSLEGVKSNRDAIGTRVEAYADDLYQYRFTHCGIGFLGQNSDLVHVGLGEHEKLDSLVITWPTGHIDRFYDISARQILSLEEGQSTNGEIVVDPDVSLNTVGIFDTHISPSFSLFPNPAQDKLMLEVPIEWLPIRYETMNILGQTLIEGQIVHETSSMAIQGLSAGTYILKVHSRSGEVFYGKWIKE